MVKPPACSSKIWRVGSLNAQAGIATHKYRDYLTGSWHHVSGGGIKEKNLRSILDHTQHLDVFGVQELDPGSLRSGQLNQAHWMAQHGGFDHCSYHVNRVTRWSQTANAILSRLPPSRLEHIRLPDRLSAPAPRGAIIAHFECPGSRKTWCAVVAHLSLSQRDRARQADFIADRLSDEPHVVLMGDFNAEPHQVDIKILGRTMDGHTPHKTYPRWNPTRAIDLIWWRGVDVMEHNVHAWGATDHCAVDMSFRLSTD